MANLELVLRPWVTVFGAEMSLLEVASALLTLASVLLLAHARFVGWLLMIAASLGYGVLFVASRLYGQAALQIMFVAIAMHGWWQWRQSAGEQHAVRVRRLSVPVLVVAVISAIAIAVVLSAWLSANTDSPLPWADAGLTSASLVAQSLQALRYLGNWPAWIIINLASTGLFAERELWATAGLYALLAGLSAQGWYQWHRAWLQQHDSVVAAGEGPA